MSLRDFVERVTKALDDCGIPYMVCGSVASTFHGRPRTTQDVDIVIEVDAAKLEKLLPHFPDDTYYVNDETARFAVRRRSMFNVIDGTTGWKADLIVRKQTPFAEAEFARRQTVDFLGLSVVMATAEDCVISKLQWAVAGGSDRQIEDVRSVVEVRGDSLDRKYIESWVARLGLEEVWLRVG